VSPVSPRSGEKCLLERTLIACGALLAGLSPFVPWFHVPSLGDLNLIRLASRGHVHSVIVVAPTILAIPSLSVAVAARRMQTVRVTSLTIGLAISVASVYATWGLLDAITWLDSLGQIGLGPIIALIGAALMVVPAIVGHIHEPVNALDRPAKLPRWLPAALAVPIAAAIAWVPDHAGPSNYCGTPAGALFKGHQPPPPPDPPLGVASRLSADQSAIGKAQKALSAARLREVTASEQQSAADAASANASNAQSSAVGAASNVSQDQADVAADQVIVQSDQGAIAVDLGLIGSDQSSVQTDQQILAFDRANGLPTAFDQTELAGNQQALAKDQASFARDQATLAADRAKVNQAKAHESIDRRSAESAQVRAEAADHQAQASQNRAERVASTAAHALSVARQLLGDAQQKLATDRRIWSDKYNTELAVVQIYNSKLSACQTRASDRFVASGGLAAAGVAVTVALVLARRRRGGPVLRPVLRHPAGETSNG
jgi:hypothetical protein